MTAQSESLATGVLQAFRNSEGGVLGLADELLQLCPTDGMRLDWRDDECHVTLHNGDDPTELHFTFPKAVFRALLARMFGICQGQSPEVANPYQGEGNFVFGPTRDQYHVAFINTPSVQHLELRRLESDSVK